MLKATFNTTEKTATDFLSTQNYFLLITDDLCFRKLKRLIDDRRIIAKIVEFRNNFTETKQEVDRTPVVDLVP